jgi:YgiT-type zinc finger domain-containing protein
MTICLICRRAQLSADITTIEFRHQEFRLAIKEVPALVCPECGESFVDEYIANRVMHIVDQNIDAGFKEDSVVFRK